jgi:PhzF family phenazine biosynthesis protein
MNLPLYQIDAFTDELFKGNPACVVKLEKWLEDDLMLKIAKENAVAETAFFVEKGDKFHLRWFTPEIEMDLCGHATLATAHAIKDILKYDSNRIIFESRSGDLEVTVEDSLYTLDLPSRPPQPAEIPAELSKAINRRPYEVLKARDYVLVYDKEEDIRNIQIDRIFFDKLELGTGGVIFTAPGRDCDFVSRFFTSEASVFEDPVTGSAHCSLVPYWSEKLGKESMNARQLSERGGVLYCTIKGERVLVSGQAKTYFTGSLQTS